MSALPADEMDSGRATQLYALAAVVIGIGAGINDRDPATWLTILAAGLAAGGFVISTRSSNRSGQAFLVRLLTIGIVGYVLIGIGAPQLLDAWYRPLLIVSGAAAIGAMYVPRMRGALVVGLVVSHVFIAAALIGTLDLPDMDVHLFQQQASAALLEGENPYELRYRNIYGEGTDLYAPELQEGDFLTFGFPYTPLSLLMAVPGYLLFGDYRYAAIGAVAVTALLLAFTRRGPLGAGAAGLLLLSPLTLRILYNGWTEAFVGVAAAAVVFAAVRLPRTTPFMLGLLIASKQYLAPVLLPAVVTLVRVRRVTGSVRLVLVPIVVAAITVVPFLVWHARDFIHSAVLMQAYQPFRVDSVSIPGLLARHGLGELPVWIAFIGGGAALVAATLWAPRTPAGFAAASALFYFTFFLLSKQAFMNYYFVVFVLVLTAVAAAMISRPKEAAS